VDSAILLLSLQALQELYFLGLRSVLPEIFDHEPVAAFDDVVEHLLWAARADSRELSLDPFAVTLFQVLRLQQGVLPFALDPGPDSLDGVEVGRARRQELNNGPFLIKEVPDYVSSVSPMIVHHNHFLEEVELPMKFLVEVFDSVFVGGIGNMVKDNFHLLADGSDDGHVALLLLGSLDDQRQHRILGLPDLVPDRPHVGGGLVHVDDLPFSSHVADYLLDVFDSQPGSFLLTPCTVETRMSL